MPSNSEPTLMSTLAFAAALIGCGRSTPTPTGPSATNGVQPSNVVAEAEPENAIPVDAPWRDVEAEIRRQQTIVGTECALYFGPGADSMEKTFTIYSGGVTLKGAVTCGDWSALPVPACGVMTAFQEGALVAAHMSDSSDSAAVRDMRPHTTNSRTCYAGVSLLDEVPAAGKALAEIEHAARVFHALVIPVEGTVATEALTPETSTKCTWQSADDGSVRSPEGEAFAADVQRVVNYDGHGGQDLVVNTGQCGNWGDCVFVLLRACGGSGYEPIWGPEYARELVVPDGEPSLPLIVTGRTAMAGCDDPTQTEQRLVAGRWQAGVTCRTGDGIWDDATCGDRTPLCDP